MTRNNISMSRNNASYKKADPKIGSGEPALTLPLLRLRVLYDVCSCEILGTVYEKFLRHTDVMAPNVPQDP